MVLGNNELNQFWEADEAAAAAKYYYEDVGSPGWEPPSMNITDTFMISIFGRNL